MNTGTQLLAVDGWPISLALPMAVMPMVAAIVLWTVAARATMASPEAWVAGNRAAQAGMQTASNTCR